jgi:hypothetical protein
MAHHTSGGVVRNFSCLPIPRMTYPMFHSFICCSDAGSTNIYTLVIVCIACFLSGAATVAILWILQSHKQKMKHQIRSKGYDVNTSIQMSKAESREPITDSSSVDMSTSEA